MLTTVDIKNPVIAVKDLNLYYGDFHALKNISIDIPKNQITALIGPSGCGKSTFLRTLNRMNDLIKNVKTDGSVKFGELSVLDRATDVVSLRKRVGMVFQRPNPFPMPIFNNVAYGLKIHRMAASHKDLEEIVVNSLKSVGLWDEVKDKLNKSAMELSGGQQQRLCIARLLAVKPEILLMDEPCSALDPIATLRIEELMHSLKENYTIVIVTHNMQQAARVSDITAFFLHGEIIEIGPTDKIFTRPGAQQTEDYITGRFG
ncbi:MAG: phosphate ABC transporter ATP-binding protein PstB [bacterium]